MKEETGYNAQCTPEIEAYIASKQAEIYELRKHLGKIMAERDALLRNQNESTETTFSHLRNVICDLTGRVEILERKYANRE